MDRIFGPGYGWGIKCEHCGSYFHKSIYTECPHCKKCEECGSYYLWVLNQGCPNCKQGTMTVGSYYKWMVRDGANLHEPLLELDNCNSVALNTKFQSSIQAYLFKADFTPTKSCNSSENWILCRFSVEIVPPEEC